MYVGPSAGAPVGVSVGSSVGLVVGSSVGTPSPVGASVGALVGMYVGPSAGAPVGVSVGSSVGLVVESSVGPSVGSSVGLSVGFSVGPPELGEVLGDEVRFSFSISSFNRKYSSENISEDPRIEPMSIASPPSSLLSSSCFKGSLRFSKAVS